MFESGGIKRGEGIRRGMDFNPENRKPTVYFLMESVCVVCVCLCCLCVRVCAFFGVYVYVYVRVCVCVCVCVVG